MQLHLLCIFLIEQRFKAKHNHSKYICYMLPCGFHACNNKNSFNTWLLHTKYQRYIRMSMCKIHNVRFYNPQPKAIYCMTFNNKSQKLALSRSDASIEIWNLKETPFVEKRFPPSVKNFSIEGLAWCGGRLFSVGLHALLFEYDLKQLNVKRSTSVTGQAAFCLDVNKQNTHVAVGTEQGYLNIFCIADDEFFFEKFLDKQEGRVLCLKYDHTGEFIASGSMDTIRVWNVKSGHAIHKMTTGRSEAQKPTIIWCIAITINFTIISGDSRGKLSFWDGSVGVQLEAYQSHRADILALCLSDDESELYCAGIDTYIICYKNIAVRGDCHKWVKSVRRKVHDHDVRALIMKKTHLYSAGVDGYLACSFCPPKTLIKYSPVSLHQEKYCEIAPQARYILLKYPKCLELWKVGVEEVNGNNETFDTIFSIKEQPKKLLVLQRQVKTDAGLKREGILASSISPNGKYIAFSTISTLRLFEFNCLLDEETILVPCDLPVKSAVVNMLFTPDNKHLIVAPQDGGLLVLNVSGDQVTEEQSIAVDKYVHDTITLMNMSPCGQYLIIADPESNIALWHANPSADKTWNFYFKLPRRNSSSMAVNFQADSSRLLIAYSDHKIFDFNLSTRKFTDLSGSVDERKIKLSKHFPIRNIMPSKDAVILYDDTGIQLVKKKPHETICKPPKVPKHTSLEKTEKMFSLHVIKKYKHLIYLGKLSERELVAVEVSPLTLLEHLPPVFQQNTFGTK